MRRRSVFLARIFTRTSCSATVLCKRIVFAMNASEKDVIFNANITCEVAYLWLVSNRLRLNNDSAGSLIKEEGKLNMYTTRVWLLN